MSVSLNESACIHIYIIIYAYVTHDGGCWTPPTPVPPQAVCLLSSFRTQGVPSGQPTPSMVFLGVCILYSYHLCMCTHTRTHVYILCVMWLNYQSTCMYKDTIKVVKVLLPFHLHSY